MVFNVLASINVFPQNTTETTYDTFTQFSNISANTVSGLGINQNLFGGQTTAISGTGQYILLCSGGTSIQVSSNSGVSFSSKTLGGGNNQCVCMNEAGDRQYVVNGGTAGGATTFWYSTDSGSTWNSRVISFGGIAVRGMACNYTTGQYVLIIGGATQALAYYSADYGATFTSFTIPTTYQFSCEVSDDGGTIYIGGNLTSNSVGRLYKSIDILEDSTTVNPTPTLTEIYNSLIGTFFEMCVSSNGQHIFIGGGSTNPTSVGFVCVSNNGGSSFTRYNLTTNARISPACSRDGKYVLVYALNLGAYYSTNYGSSGFTTMATTDFIGANPPATMTTSWYGVAVDKTGQHAILGTQTTTGTGKLWYGTNTVV